MGEGGGKESAKIGGGALIITPGGQRRKKNVRSSEGDCAQKREISHHQEYIFCQELDRGSFLPLGKGLEFGTGTGGTQCWGGLRRSKDMGGRTLRRRSHEKKNSTNLRDDFDSVKKSVMADTNELGGETP